LRKPNPDSKTDPNPDPNPSLNLNPNPIARKCTARLTKLRNSSNSAQF